MAVLLLSYFFNFVCFLSWRFLFDHGLKKGWRQKWYFVFNSQRHVHGFYRGSFDITFGFCILTNGVCALKILIVIYWQYHWHWDVVCFLVGQSLFFREIQKLCPLRLTSCYQIRWESPTNTNKRINNSTREKHSFNIFSWILKPS